MASFPTSIFSPRALIDRAGIVYNALKTHTFFAKDHNDTTAEIVAIETFLKNNLVNGVVVWQSNLSDIALWIKKDVYSSDWPGVAVPSLGTFGTMSYFWITTTLFLLYPFQFLYDFSWEASLYEEHSGTGNVGEFGFGVSNGTKETGFGFRSKSDKCYAFFRSYTVESIVELDDLAFWYSHLYTARFFVSDQSVHFYIDKVEVAVIAKPSGTYYQNTFFGVSMLNNTTDYADLKLFNVSITRFYP